MVPELISLSSTLVTHNQSLSGDVFAVNSMALKCPPHSRSLGRGYGDLKSA